ncbi:phenylalanine--tRNA ligase subunit beta [Alkalicoccobacillus murimartini]|uniref:Phenylalanine--tRNA ligase beta subunit n=1 Tax=Alkalicoccobacillus murimartini TaxID=171685 RepID=A0ABT9YJQ6_9BACI|nr:phenylalanine--tRNA ligase subunit beta [Alkalicoccobacillus murimartini]MDQ0208067.1 phenylalanyl-tRNA synthetase beta chain [Alkalicoccobacillus murimartini]
MLVSYNWLKQYVDLSDVSPAEIAEKMTRGGVEIDFVHTLNQGATSLVAGYVESCEQHPDADKLNICQVDIGEEEPVQIICGAANIAAGQTVVVAKIGARLPGDIKIKKAKLRGQLSQGMICSLQELGLDANLVPKEMAEGIYVFPNDIAPGTDALEALNLTDEVLELDLTPNRSDCLNMIGVAYEVAALYGKEVTLPDEDVQLDSEKADSFVSIEVENKEDASYYEAIVIKDVQVGASPQWLQNRLMAAGIRPINNVVDSTNYVLLEYGQPLHAFDYDKLASDQILVRRAKQGEELVTLDGQERSLSKEQLVITNGEHPVALAGVMGGKNTEVDENTKTVLLEAAVFQSSLVRQASRTFGLRSDSSTRFEKGINPENTPHAAKRAAKLIKELASGRVLSGEVRVDARNLTQTKIDVHLKKMNERLGLSLTAEETGAIFDKLKFHYDQTEDGFVVEAPFRRLDLMIQEDLYEEVARIYGYDNIPATLPEGATTQGTLSPYQAKRRRLARYLESSGLSQVMTYSLTSPEKARAHKKEDQLLIQLSMPMSEERSTMRTSLLPHLYDVLTYNVNRKNQNVHVYEMGSIFHSTEPTLQTQPSEQELLAGALTGVWHENSWQGEKKVVDFFVVKGLIEGIFVELGLDDVVTYQQSTRTHMHPGRTAECLLNGKSIGYVGQLHPAVQKENDLRETYVFELDLDALLNADAPMVQYQTLPRFPSISRDIALVVNQDQTAGELEDIIRAAGTELLKSVNLFDHYEGEHLEDGKKSLAFSLLYLDPEKTLTDAEVEEVHQKVLDGLKSEAGATLRQ